MDWDKGLGYSDEVKAESRREQEGRWYSRGGRAVSTGVGVDSRLAFGHYSPVVSCFGDHHSAHIPLLPPFSIQHKLGKAEV